MACTPQKKFSGGGPGACGYIAGGEDPNHECGPGKKCDGLGACMTMTTEQNQGAHGASNMTIGSGGVLRSRRGEPTAAWRGP